MQGLKELEFKSMHKLYELMLIFRMCYHLTGALNGVEDCLQAFKGRWIMVSIEIETTVSLFSEMVSSFDFNTREFPQFLFQFFIGFKPRVNRPSIGKD